MFPNLTEPEKVMPNMAILAGFVISGAIAAVMSTADSQLLVVASSVVEDIYRKILGRETTNEGFVFISRITTVLVALFGFTLGQVLGRVSGHPSGLVPAFFVSLMRHPQTNKTAI